MAPRTPGEAGSARASGRDLRENECQPRLSIRFHRVVIWKARTDANVPRPRAGNVPRNEDIRRERVQQEDPAPYIEGVMAVVRQQERVLDPVMSVSTMPASTATGVYERELVDREAHEHRGESSDDSVPADGSTKT